MIVENPYIFTGVIFGAEVLAIGFLFYLAERKKPADQNTPYFKSDFQIDFLYMIMNFIFFGPIFGFIFSYIAASYLALIIPYQAFSGFIQGLPLVVQFIAGLLILDLITYWRHRFTHIYMWPYHSIHHSAEQITWITKFRLHPLDIAAAVLFGVFGLHILGFQGVAIGWAFMVQRGVDYFAHANIDFKLPRPLRYFLNTPHFHRWHHANQKDAYNKNFSALFPFYDALFGTYLHPEQLPNKYGLMKKEMDRYPLDSYWKQLLYPFYNIGEFFKKRHTPKQARDAIQHDD